MPNLRDKEILQKTIDYCVQQLGMKELGIEGIGNVPEQPLTYAEIWEHDRLPEIITYDVLRLFAAQACKENILDAVNYFAHFPILTVLKDLRDMELPEYTLEWLVTDAGYIKSRQDNIYTVSYEEELKDCLACMENKYGKKKVKKLKRRLGISEIMECLIDEHHKKYREP